METINIPSFNESSEAIARGDATALQQFVYDNEPAEASDSYAFRTGLESVLLEQSRALPAEVQRVINAAREHYSAAAVLQATDPTERTETDFYLFAMAQREMRDALKAPDAAPQPRPQEAGK